MKVRITKVPNKKDGGTNGSATQMHSGPQTPPTDAMADPRTGKFHGGNTPEIKINRTLKPTSRENATLEAELGETVVTNLQGDGIPEFYKIGGKPHSRGGTPLNLPKSSFIFSKDNKLKIKEPDVLDMFGKTGKAAKKGYTPADISKNYDINTYREILANPFSDKLQRETAELMIKNYNLKLGSLALVQESMKGFDSGIPEIAQAYMESVGIAPDELILSEPPAKEQLQQFKGGGTYKGKSSSKRVRIIKALPKAQIGNGEWNEYTMSLNSPEAWSKKIGYTEQNNPENTQQVLKEYAMWRKANPWVHDNKKPKDPWDINEYQAVPRFQDGGPKELPKAQYGIPKFKPGGATGKQAPKVSGKPTAKQNIPKDAWLWDENAEGYDPSKVKVNHYVLKDGRYRKVTGYQKRKYEGDQKEEKLGKYSDEYFMMVDKFEKNPALKTAMYERHKKVLENTKPGKHLTQDQIDVAHNMSEEEVFQNFIYKQKSNLAIKNQLGDLSEADAKDLWDSDPELAKKAAEDAGFPPLDTEHIAAFQATYVGMNELMNDPEFKGDFKDFGLFQHGLGDESISGNGDGTISQVDGFDGNTTSGEVMMSKDSEMLTEDVADIKEDAPQVSNHLGQLNDVNRAGYWTEDNMNVARDSRNLMSVKKYRPWQGTPAFELADPNFVDFRGAANRMAAQTAGLAKGASNFDPGTYGTLANNMQGQMANNVLKLQEQEMAKNVDTANRFELSNTAAINAYNQAKAKRDTTLWDKNAIMNQQFDNSKMALRNNLSNSIRDRHTNRGKLDNLNSTSEEYYIDSNTGFKHKKPGYIPIDPAAQNTALSDKARAIMDQSAGMEYDTAMDWAKADAGITGKKQTDAFGSYPGAKKPTVNNYYNTTQRKKGRTI